MKTMLKRMQIISLAAFVGFGAMAIISEASVQHTASNQYVLSRYFPHGKLIRSPQGQNSQVTTTTISLPKNTQASSNWAGYITTHTSSSGYTNVSGSWKVPSISTNNQSAVAAQWIGLGGVSSSDLLQMGTMEQMENGQPMAEVFWEQLPAVAQNVVSVPIDSTISVSISEDAKSSSTWDLTFTAKTPDGQTQTQTVSTTLDSSYAQGIGTSAEWISEDPSTDNGQLVPLANMGTVSYQSATVDGQPLNASGNSVQPVAMVSNNRTVAIAPSALGTDGESFTTTNANSSTNSTSRHRISGTKGFPMPVGVFNQNQFGWNLTCPWR